MVDATFVVMTGIMSLRAAAFLAVAASAIIAAAAAGQYDYVTADTIYPGKIHFHFYVFKPRIASFGVKSPTSVFQS